MIPGVAEWRARFGFEESKFKVSQAVGERVLLPAVREAGSETFIVSDGFSCREQIQQATGRKALHLAEIMEFALRTEGFERNESRGYQTNLSAQIKE